MTPAERVAQVLALARSTPYPAERETALEIARRLHNTHRLRDPHLRWELQTALGQDAGPEPPRPVPPAPEPAWPFWDKAETEATGDPGPDPFMWTAQDADWLRDLWEEAARSEQREQRRRQRTGGPGQKRQKRRIYVQPHDAWRHHWYSVISGYTREVRTHQVTFTCQWCGERVTQQRWPGRPPAYCTDDCRRDAEREQTRERVRRHRAAKRAAEHTEQER